MSSNAFDLATIIGVLDQVDSHLGGPAPWTASGPLGEQVLALRAQLAPEVARLRHLEGCASDHADELNAFLSARGFTTRFGPLASAEFGAVSTLREATVWPMIGRSVPVRIAGVDYHGFRLKSHVFAYDAAPGLLVRMPSGPTDESVMWVLIGDDLPDGSDPLIMFARARAALAAADGRPIPYDSVTMPAEALERTTPLDWLVGLRRSGGTITKALQEAILRVDRRGSEARVATSVMVLRGMVMTRDLVIDQPHLVFWTDAEVPTMPLAVVRFEADAWSAYDVARATAENQEVSR
jgi:hypothetical protein